jgi:hypothetical protein
LIDLRWANPRRWPDRAHELPAGKVAGVAFCLTLALGLGGPAAVALWNQTAQVSVPVKGGTTSVPVFECDDSAVSSATVSWSAVNATSYSYTVAKGTTVEGPFEGASVTLTAGSASLGDLLVGLLGGTTRFTVTATAYYGGTWTSMGTQRVDYHKPLLGAGEWSCIR